MRKAKGLGIREIARKTNLNISTVSRALNHSFQVSRETMELVLKTANEMGYRPAVQRKDIIVLLPSSDVEMAWYSLNLINALCSELRRRNYRWEFINSDRVDIIQERSVSGIISLDFNGSTAHLIGKNYHLPTICINDAPSHLDNVFSVVSDAVSAINLALDCLRDFGHHRIAFIGGGNNPQGNNRKKAFLDAVAVRGIAEECRYIVRPMVTSHGIVRELYSSGVTGIISDGESAGLKIFNSLQFCKIRVPQDMSLITWEMPYVSALMQPGITTVGQDFERLAESAVLLLERQQQAEIPMSDITVSYKLRLRDSVSLPRDAGEKNNL